MKKKRIAVCDSEAGFACDLAEYLNHKKKLPFYAEAFTDTERFCACAGKSPPGLLLISRQDMNEQVEALGVPCVVLLSEEKIQEEAGHKQIYKYQSAESMLREVMEYYTRNIGMEPGTRSLEKLDIIGVYSPLGRCGKTLLSLTLGQILGEEKEVLYVNMEDYSGFPDLMGGKGEKSLSDLFYEIRCRKEGGAGLLDGLVLKGGQMDYISPALSWEDIRAVSFSEWSEFFYMLEKETRYQTLILDIGNGCRELLRILELCRIVYMPVLKDWPSQCKLRQFRRLIESFPGGPEEKLVELFLPAGPILHMGQEPWQQLTWGSWGTWARQLLKEHP